MAVLSQARVGKGRVNAFRLNHYSAVVTIAVAGVARADILKGSLTIRDVNGSQPNTCQFDTCLNPGWAPARGDVMRVAIGDASQVLFGGTIVEVTQGYKGTGANLFYSVQAMDFHRLFNRRLVWATYTGYSADAVVRDVIANCSSGFTFVHVPTGLAVIDITFDGVTPGAALDQIAKLIGVTWEIDADRDVWFPVGTQRPNPATVTESNVYAFTYSRDDRQVRTRVYATVGKSTVLAPVAIGGTTIPVADISPFIGATRATVQGQVVTYSGTAFGDQTGSNTSTAAASGGPAAPAVTLGSSASTFAITSITRSSAVATVTTSAPHGLATGAIIRIAGAVQPEYNGDVPATVTGASTFTYPVPGSPATPATGTITGQKAATGGVVGAVTYKITAASAAGAGVLGTASASVTGAAPAAPTVAPTATVGHGTSCSASIARVGTVATVTSITGAHGCTVGEPVLITGATPAAYNGIHQVSRIVSTTVFEFTIVGAPATPATGSIVVTHSLAGPLVGTYQYGYSFVTDRGETRVTPTGSVALGGVVAGVSFSAVQSTTIDGGLSGGASSSRGYMTSFVLSNGGTTAPFGFNGASLTQVAAPGACSLARATGGGLGGGTYQYAVTYYTAAGETHAGSSASIFCTNGDAVTVSSIPTSSDGRVIGRKIYRTKVGGSTLYHVATLGDNTTTTYVDQADDLKLTVLIPASNTTGSQINLTGISTSTDQRVVGRKLWASKLGTTAPMYLLATLGDNTTTTFTDTTPDAALTDQAPDGDIDNGSGVRLSAIAISSDPRVKARRLYRTAADGTALRVLATISDNLTTTYTDQAPDTALGITTPADPQPGGDAVLLSAVPLGAVGTTARQIHRTKGGGAVYYLVGSIGDNTTTTYLDARADVDLADVSIDSVLTAAIFVGQSTLPVDDLSQFQAGGGWVFVDGQRIHYTGRSGTSGAGTLTGIPASGDGAILTNIKAGAAVINDGLLTGVTGIVRDIPQGADIRAVVMAEDTAAQAALAAREGGDGVHEHLIDAGEKATLGDGTDQAEAELRQFAAGDLRVRWRAHDLNTRSGRSLTINMAAPHSLTGTMLIQDVTITGFEAIARSDGTWQVPTFDAEASSARFSLQDLLRLVALTRNQRG